MTTLLTPAPGPIELNIAPAIPAVPLTIAQIETALLASATFPVALNPILIADNVTQAVAGLYTIGGIYSVTRSLSVAELQSLFTVPVTFAPGQAGRTLIPCGFQLRQAMGAVLWSVGPAVGVTYTAIPAFQGLVQPAQISNIANEIRTLQGQMNNVTVAANFATDGKGLMFYSGADRTGGSGTYRATCIFTVAG